MDRVATKDLVSAAMRVPGRILLCAAVAAGCQVATASPDLLVPAMKYGATDCGFCHATPQGGEAHNERGLWLIAERERRGAEAVDVAWLAARDTLVAKSTPPPQTEARLADLAAIKTRPEDRRRMVDYTTAHGDWPAYGGGLRAQKYSPVDQISASNVDDLAIAWVWEAFDNHRYVGALNRRKTPDGFKATPLMAGGRLFVRTAFSAVAALDPTSGETLWTFDPGTGDGPRPPVFGFSTRGLAYHRDDDAGDRILLVASDGWLIALSAETGKPLADFGEDGRVDLSKGLRRTLPRRTSTWNYAPALCGDVVVLGNQTHDGSHMLPNWRENVPLGDVRGFDVKTGRQVWVFETIPQAGEFGNDTWGEESWRWMGNTNVWSMMSCDPELGFVYLPVTAPSSHFYGGLRPGDNLFGTSLVAVDARTGKHRWHYQTVHHDIWDYDLPAAPVVADIVMNGKPVAGRRAGQQGRLSVRLRPRHRRTAVADRGTGRAREHPRRRGSLAHPAVPDMAAAVRNAGLDRGRPHRLHAATPQARPAETRRHPNGWLVSAGIGTRQPGGTRLGRGRQLGRCRLRPGDPHALRRLPPRAFADGRPGCAADTQRHALSNPTFQCGHHRDSGDQATLVQHHRLPSRHG